MSIEAVIFVLDGVIVSTDEFHYLGWKKIADEEGIPFDRERNHRLRGVSRMESLAILLEPATRQYSAQEKEILATRKNSYYRDLLNTLSPADILPGVMEFCDALRKRGIKLAIGSSSRNSPAILQQIGLGSYFDATADGNDITRSKPDPEVFLLAAKKLGVKPADALVVEDAESGVAAAIAGGFHCIAVGAAAGDSRAHLQAADLTGVSVDDVLSLGK
jgi:beta-phosphoglucomutase